MITVRRGNVRLKVQPEDKRYYLDKGYDVIDEKGNVLERALPRDIDRMKKLYLDTLAENNRYKKQVEDLTKEIDVLNAKLKKKKQN